MNLPYLLQTAKLPRQPEVAAAAEFSQTCPFFEWLIVNIPTSVKLSGEQLAEPLAPAPGHGLGAGS